jgi:NAD(P)-dependent dehydrogenase (short-subunit alcohol dehydrogenase family)
MTEKHHNGPVLITGCSSGLGHAAALAFRRAGWLTIASARNINDLADLAAHGCETVQLDVADETSRRTAIGAIERQHGQIGVLVNNAGYGQYGPLEEIAPQAVRDAFETNVFGLLHLIQLVLPGMRRAGRGRIVNISSVAGRISVPGGAIYHMTKYSIEALADALRPEVKTFGIDVVNVLPGPFISRYFEKAIASIPPTNQGGPYEIYKDNIRRYLQSLVVRGAFGPMSAEQVAAVVLKAGTTARPRTRYYVGALARLAPIARTVAPDHLVDAYMRWRIPEN